MKTNMGTIDKAIRLIAAGLIIGLYFAGNISGIIGLVLLVFALIFMLTSLLSFCPLYMLFGISTKKKKDHKS